MKTNHSDAQLQAAIDGACKEIAKNHPAMGGSIALMADHNKSTRLDLIKSALAALPEPKQLLSQLRPISEAGPVPEGCVRVYGYHHDPESRWALTTWQDSQDTHFADIRPTHSTRMTNDEIITNDRLFDLVRYARAILHAADLITDSEYIWLCSRNQGEPSRLRLESYDQLRAANSELIECLAEAVAANAAIAKAKGDQI